MAISVLAIFLLMMSSSSAATELYLVNGSRILCTSEQVSLICKSDYLYLEWYLLSNNYRFIRIRSYYKWRRSTPYGIINTKLTVSNGSNYIASFTLTASNYSGPVSLWCDYTEPIQLLLNVPILNTDIVLHPLDHSGDTTTLSGILSPNLTDKYSIQLSPQSEVTVRDNIFEVSLLAGITYNITILSCGRTKHFKIGNCPLLSSSSSYQVLQYNFSSSGVQTVSVLRCDCEGEVVVMKCTENGDWESVNQQINMCSDLTTKTTFANGEIIYSVLTSTTAIIIYGATILCLIIFCFCGFILGFFCVVRHNNSKHLRERDATLSLNGNQHEEERVEPAYEEINISTASTDLVIKPNIAYAEVQL